MSDFIEYKPMDVEHNVKAAVENLRKAYWSNDTEKVAKIFTEAEDIIVSAICHDTYTVGKPDEEKPQGDLISRGVAINLLNEAQVKYDEYYKGLGKAKTIIDSTPPAPERPKGKWIICNQDNEGIHKIECPFCKYVNGSDFGGLITLTFDRLPPFCENCGADMRGGNNE